MDCLITVPNSVVHQVCVSKDATGQECLEKMCSLLGIVECDYFGLRYKSHHGLNLWLNNRVKIKSQLKSKPPHCLQLRVKYFVDPKMLQQPATRHTFFLQVKTQLADGQLPVKGQVAAKMGALLFQAELGDSQQQTGYPQCFRDWGQGMARSIAKEHAKLKGMSKGEAEKNFLELASNQEHWGVSYTRVSRVCEEGQGQHTCFLGIGGSHIRLCDKEWKLVKRIPYQYLMEASFHNRVFTIAYQSANEENQPVQKTLSVNCPHHRIARYLFRLLTEDHTFFTHQTVSSRVRDHVRYKPWRHFCQHYLRMNPGSLYYFDVQRTMHEAYSHAWEVLHQVNQEELTASISRQGQQTEMANVTQVEGGEAEREDEEEEEPSSTDDNNTALQHNQIELQLESNSEHSSTATSSRSHIDLAGYGLSKSSCDIAKELLEYSTSSTSVTAPQGVPKKPTASSKVLRDGAEGQASKPRKLSKEGTEKLRQLLQKIRDSKLCRVCMDSPVSAVFCPCGHYMSCYNCAVTCSRCPLCRHDIAYVQYVYSSGV